MPTVIGGVLLGLFALDLGFSTWGIVASEQGRTIGDVFKTWRGIHMARAEKKFGDASRWRELLSPDMPLKRVATPQEIADVVLFLASDRASWICGEVVNVDGGQLHRDNWF